MSKPTFWQKVACCFGQHPANPRALIIGEAYYVCGLLAGNRLPNPAAVPDNEPTPWIEQCPRCGRWHLASYRKSIYRSDSPEAKRIHADRLVLGWEW